MWLWFEFPWWIVILVILNIFSCIWWPLNVIFGKKIYSDILSIFKIIFFLLLSCMWDNLYLNINPYSIRWFTNIFLPLIGYLFILLIFAFVVQKFLSLIHPYLLIFAFLIYALMSWKKSLPRPMSRFPLCSLLGVLYLNLFLYPFLVSFCGWYR